MPVKVKREIVGFKGDECDCGRRATILHCNACGSTRIYSRTGKLHTHLDGTTSFVEIQYRCQTCGHLFIQDERQFCDAPPISEALARLKVQRLAQARQQGEYLRPEDEKLADMIDKVIGSSQEPQTIQDFEKTLDPRAVEEVNSMPKQEPPQQTTYSREEYDVVDRTFRLEWAQKKLMGQDTGISADEYVARRMKGEMFQ